MNKAMGKNAGCQPQTADGALRPTLRQKTRYVPHSPPEEFIVPLLRGEIEFCLSRYATPLRGRARAVDIGCGAQPFRASLEGIGYSYCGVDANPQDASVDVVCAIDGPLPEDLLSRGPFDFLLCTEVLEHVGDWDKAFGNFRALLAPGGRILITTPYFYQLHEEPFDFWRPTLHAINYYGSRAGFEPIYRQAAGDAWDVLGTTLANCRFVASSDRFADRVLAKGIRATSRLVFGALLRRKIQRRVRVQAPLYLSNVAVFEKPGHS